MMTSLPGLAQLPSMFYTGSSGADHRLQRRHGLRQGSWQCLPLPLAGGFRPEGFSSGRRKERGGSRPWGRSRSAVRSRCGPWDRLQRRLSAPKSNSAWLPWSRHRALYPNGSRLTAVRRGLRSSIQVLLSYYCVCFAMVPRLFAVWLPPAG